MQYVEVRFARSPRLYCYHWAGETLAPGDKVDVVTERGEMTVEVVSIRERKPPFNTKPIARVVSLAPRPAADAPASDAAAPADGEPPTR